MEPLNWTHIEPQFNYGTSMKSSLFFNKKFTVTQQNKILITLFVLEHFYTIDISQKYSRF